MNPAAVPRWDHSESANSVMYLALLDPLDNLDRDPDTVLRTLRAGSSDREALRALRRWRLFFLAVAELFATGGGAEWMVAQYLLSPAARTAAR